jgi:hypothetical protein
MTNINNNETVVAANENVVSHDNTQSPITASPPQTNTNKHSAVYNQLENLIVQRQVWEDEVFRASNDRLYSILQSCYALYVKAGTREDAKALTDALNQQANLKGIKFTSSAHTLTKIMKCVFGADRRRASAYSIALRAAHAARVKPEDLPSYIRDKGGVEEVRLSKGNAMKPAEKAEKAADYVASNELAVVNTPEVSALLDTAKVDEYVVLVALQGANGSLSVKAIVSNKSVVDAALASVYSINKTAITTKTTEQSVTANTDSICDAVDAAVQSIAA